MPEKLIERLRNHNEFQGARYEVAVAAAFIKCGFEIEWIEDRTGPHPEFIARNKGTGEEVAVEAKSRHRLGALHQPGVLPPAEELRADVDRLYKDTGPQFLLSVPIISTRPLRSPETLRCLQGALNTYGVAPNEY